MIGFNKLGIVLVLILTFTGLRSLDATARPKALAGPIQAFVERVVDGDTLVVRARIWLGQELKVMVRISGIDAPELRARCDKERQIAVSARQFVKRLVGQRKVTLSHIRQGKYAGRVIADVTDKSGSPLSAHLLKANLARPYHRGRRKSWCTQKPVRPVKKAQIASKIQAP
ncbi:MAG: hypothetical protein GY927_10060 [bacterium]|nr:hypothetical protein [bacterium]